MSKSTVKASPFANAKVLSAEDNFKAVYNRRDRITVGVKGRNGSVKGLAPERMFAALAKVANKSGVSTVGDYLDHFEPLCKAVPLPSRGTPRGILRFYATMGVLIIAPFVAPARKVKAVPAEVSEVPAELPQV
jgi:hypothetical protein